MSLRRSEALYSFAQFTDPSSADAQNLRAQLAEKYDVSCVAVNCLELRENDIVGIIKSVLYEFPLSELGIYLPAWMDALPLNHPVKASLFTAIRESCGQMYRIRDIEPPSQKSGTMKTSAMRA